MQKEKQIETIEDHREKQINALENRIEKNFWTQIKNQSLLCSQKIF